MAASWSLGQTPTQTLSNGPSSQSNTASRCSPPDTCSLTPPRPFLLAERTIGRTINRPEALSIQTLQETNANPERGQGDGATNENVISFNTVFEIEVQFYSGLVTSEAQVLTPKGGNAGGKPLRVQVNLLNGGFVTHSTHMSQRLVGLEVVGYVMNR